MNNNETSENKKRKHVGRCQTTDKTFLVFFQEDELNEHSHQIQQPFTKSQRFWWEIRSIQKKKTMADSPEEEQHSMEKRKFWMAQQLTTD